MGARSIEKAAQIDAIVSIKARVPEDAMSAGLLGTERSGHGVRIREDGLIVTIGYVVHEADTVWIGSRDGMTVPGFVVGYDFDSGFALVKPSLPLDGPVMELGTAAILGVGDAVRITSSGETDVMEAYVVAKQEFAGRWEYLLDEAIFTAPPHESWSGAALVDAAGRLCGLGSLVIQGFEINGSLATVNMFVPIDLLEPIIDEICDHGRRWGPPRPWLGLLVHDEHELLTIVGVYRNCPADKAGLRPGDVIVEVNDRVVSGLSDLFRCIWRMGSAGVEVPISVMRDTEKVDVVVQTADRAEFQHKGTLQ